MEQILETALRDPLGYLIGLLGILASITIYFRSKSRVDLRFVYKHIREVSRISSAHRKIKVTFEKNEVPRVTRTLICIWNNGRRPLRRDDIPKNDRLTFTLHDPKADVEILDFDILKVVRPSTNFTVKGHADAPGVVLDFDYLDRRDGAIIEIQHTGTADASLVLGGVILGPHKVVKVNEKVFFRPFARDLFSTFWEQIFQGPRLVSISFAIALLLSLYQATTLPERPPTIVAIDGIRPKVISELRSEGFRSTQADSLAERMLDHLPKAETPTGLKAIGWIMAFSSTLALWVSWPRTPIPSNLLPGFEFPRWFLWLRLGGKT